VGFSDGFITSYQVIEVLDEGLLVQKVDFNSYQSDTRYRDPFFLKNYPEQKTMADNNKISFLALRTGNYKYTDTQGAVRTVPLYDYGTPLSFQEMNAILHPPLTPEQQAAQTKAEQASRAAGKQSTLKFYQSKAAAGDGFAQMRLGEIYLHGEGVETNTDLARKWLSAALTNGYPQATNLLFEIERSSARSK
jgi:TPR repeat protein